MHHSTRSFWHNLFSFAFAFYVTLSCFRYFSSYVVFPFVFCIVNMFFFLFFSIFFLSAIQYLQMKWPLLDVQAGSLQSRQALKDARSPSPAHIVVSSTQESLHLQSSLFNSVFSQDKTTSCILHCLCTNTSLLSRSC